MLVTDRNRCRPSGLIDAIEFAVAAGVDVVQLREKDLDASALYDLALTLRDLTRGRCLLIVNSSLDVALAAGADGVHLPETGLQVAAARLIAPPGFLVGKSVHSLASALQAQQDGASYVQLGTIFTTASKPGLAPSGLALVRAVTASLDIPCLAVGGIDAGNAGEAIEAGAAGIAVVSAILMAADVHLAVEELRAVVATASGAKRA